MTATPYLLTANAAATLKDGVNVMAVNANSEAEAEAMASAHYDGESNLRWTAPTATSLGTAPNDWEDWTMTVTLSKTGEDDIVATATAGSGDAFADLIGDLVTALNATAIDNAAFDTDTLTVASGGGDDDLGDYSVAFSFTSPNGTEFSDLYVDSITDGGASTDDLEIVLVANATISRTVTPTVVGVYS